MELSQVYDHEIYPPEKGESDFSALESVFKPTPNYLQDQYLSSKKNTKHTYKRIERGEKKKREHISKIWYIFILAIFLLLVLSLLP